MSDWDYSTEQAIIEALTYDAWPYSARVVRARKRHQCSLVGDVSWFRACRTVEPGEQYVRVAVFWPWRRAPLAAAVCRSCADGYAELPRIPEEVASHA